MFSSGRLFTGVLILLIGVLLLLNNLGVFGWGLWLNLVSLWPLLIISLGLRLIFRKGPLAALSPLVLVIMVVLAIVMPTGYYRGGQEDSTFRQALDPSVTEALLVVGSGATDLRVSGSNPGAGDLVFVSERWVGRPTVWTHTRQGTKATVRGSRTFAGAVAFSFSMREVVNRTSIVLNESIPWSVEVNCGASSINLDLSAIEVQRLDIGSGASKIDVLLGDRALFTDVDIRAGFVSVDLTIPLGVGVKVEERSALSGDNLGSLGFRRQGDVWLSPDYDGASRFVHVRMEGGFSSFNIHFSGPSGVSL